VERLNAWLDRLPPSVWITGQEMPAFQLAGLCGFAVSTSILAVAVVVTELSPLIAVGLVAVLVDSAWFWALARRTLTGRENLVLLEHVWVAVAAGIGYLLVLREPITPWLDLLAPGLATFLAFGRVGCLTAGCCHGLPSTIGPRNRSNAGPRSRLFPVQLIEAMCLAVLAITGWVLALSRPSTGVAAVALGLAYPVIRLGTEQLRGDRRRRLLGPSINEWMAVAQLATMIIIGTWWLTGAVDAAELIMPGTALLSWAVLRIRRQRVEQATPEVVESRARYFSPQ
jgi:hypothetical protein